MFPSDDDDVIMHYLSLHYNAMLASMIGNTSRLIQNADCVLPVFVENHIQALLDIVNQNRIQDSAKNKSIKKEITENMDEKSMSSKKQA